MYEKKMEGMKVLMYEKYINDEDAKEKFETVEADSW